MIIIIIMIVIIMIIVTVITIIIIIIIIIIVIVIIPIIIIIIITITIIIIIIKTGTSCLVDVVLKVKTLAQSKHLKKHKPLSTIHKPKAANLKPQPANFHGTRDCGCRSQPNEQGASCLQVRPQTPNPKPQTPSHKPRTKNPTPNPNHQPSALTFNQGRLLLHGRAHVSERRRQTLAPHWRGRRQVRRKPQTANCKTHQLQTATLDAFKAARNAYMQGFCGGCR